jgi:hypothetical protein
MPIELALVLLVAAGAAAFLVPWWRRVPRADRDWAADHAVPARVTFTGGEARIEGLRDFRHTPDGRFAERYRDELVRLADVRGVWLVVAPFAAWQGLAHVFVSFELAGDRFISVSVEARRERGESYSVLGGMFRKFELTYVIGTEPDLLGARGLRGDRLLLYRSRATPEQARALFLDMLRGAEAFRREPRFYHSLTLNCATVLLTHVNRVLPARIPYGLAAIFPGYLDGVALARGFLESDVPIAAARARFRVDEHVRRALSEGGDVEFSRRIRSGHVNA